MKLTGAQILCETLERLGVRHIFGYPGGAILPVYDAIGQSKLHHILVRHEQGATHGLMAGHVAPEAAVGGSIAVVRDGDTITFDLPKRTLNVELSDTEIERRLASWQAPKPRFANGVMAKYALLVSSSSLGAVTSLPASFSSGTMPVSTGRTL